MAGVVRVNVVVHGKGGHGSRPDLSINPVFAAANMLVNAAGTFINQLNVAETVTFGITTIMGGGIPNTFPDTAAIKGSLRFFDPQEGEKALELLKKTFSLTAEMHNCTADFAETDIGGPPTVANYEKAAFALKALGEVMPPETFVPCPRWFASESWGRYLATYPGVFTFVGVTNPELGSGAEAHNEKYDMDERALPLGALATVKYALAHLA
jgi:metal-dependent amidase/aminoacylase/carboxypeptidase family protein